jgi:hypothetical protein
MALSDMEHAAGMREFPLRIRHRVIVFDPSKRWWMHCVDAQGRTFERYWLSFSDVESQLKDQPNALDEARKLERSR